MEVVVVFSFLTGGRSDRSSVFFFSSLLSGPPGAATAASNQQQQRRHQQRRSSAALALAEAEAVGWLARTSAREAGIVRGKRKTLATGNATT